MQQYMTITALGISGGVLFFFALGAICGSFINVLVYRLPRGLNIVTPPSACPACGTRLSWRQNFPIFGWLLLRGRCRFCKSKISPEYPIVELVVAVLFATVFLWFADPYFMEKLGFDIRAWRPEWAADGLGRMWPTVLIILALFGSFVAATLIDARTFLIPIVLPWFATAVALVVHPAHALWVQVSRGGLADSRVDWTLDTVNGPLLAASLGGAIGVIVSVSLLALGWIPRSFADYEQWEAEQQRMSAETASAEIDSDHATQQSDMRLLIRRVLFLTGPAIALMFIGFTVGLRYGFPYPGIAIGLGTGLVVGLALRRTTESSPSENSPQFLSYPHPRREMGKELLFVVPIVALAALGYWLAGRGGLAEEWAGSAPLWLRAFGGALFGYLVAGGAVWITRIGGTLALGAEAMGMGDVHLMAAAGAALGWIDPVLAFFTAPFFGIAWAILGVTGRRFFHASGSALPYGPHLAVATIGVVLLKPLYESLLSWILGGPINIP